MKCDEEKPLIVPISDIERVDLKKIEPNPEDLEPDVMMEKPKSKRAPRKKKEEKPLQEFIINEKFEREMNMIREENLQLRTNIQLLQEQRKMEQMKPLEERLQEEKSDGTYKKFQQPYSSRLKPIEPPAPKSRGFETFTFAPINRNVWNK
ncbi:MAG: hypothetical protein ACXWEW_11915 [Nitrososphaeraceae archaeon]